MDCEEAKRLILDELDGTVPPGVRKELMEHLGSCEKCSEERFLVLEGVGVLRRTVQELSGEGTRSVVPKLKHDNRERFLVLIRQAALAATLLIAVAAFIVSKGIFRKSNFRPKIGYKPVPVFITLADPNRPENGYYINVPSNVEFGQEQLNEIRRYVKQIMTKPRKKAGKEEQFRRYPIVPVVPISGNK